MCKKNSELCSLFFVVLTIFSLGLALVACQPRSGDVQQSVLSGPIMGTDYRVTVVHAGKQDLTTLEHEIVAAMQSVNQSMSNYLADSELSIFNASQAGVTQSISKDFRMVMEEAIQIGELTDGAFDVTLGKAIDLWGFGPDGQITEQPSDKDLAALQASSGFQKLMLEGNQLSKSHDALSINLSAIAKGYAVDKVAKALQKQGVRRFLINIGGELRASGKSLENTLWRVGIEKPHILGGIQQIAVLDNQAIATSGDYRNYHIIDGQQFSHTIDPKTLKPVFHKLALVSIISDKTSTADALATALMAMGETRAVEFAEREQLAAYLLIREGGEGQFRIHVTEKFRANLQ